ncbi:MAG: PKD domain-containing protein, partial [Cryomorphaceae bacterium]|nr:PKD domain-containing protein [Cryomorphaceae bacterium]
LKQSYTVYPKPTAAFSPSDTAGCQPFTVNFQSQSTANQSGMDSLQFEWLFGDGQISTLENPGMIFTNTGVEDSVYSVTLIVTNAFGCKDTLMDSVTVHPLPKSQFTAISQGDCAPFTIDSNIISPTAFPLANANYHWLVTDNNGTPLHTHSGINGFTYTISMPSDSIIIHLITTSLYGCENDTTSLHFVTDPDPEANFILNDTISCTPLILQTTNNSQLASTNEWFVDGVLESTLPTPQITLTNTGIIDSVYEIMLIVGSPNGCLDTAIQLVTVLPGPTAAFTHTEVCHTDTTQFFDQSTGNRPIVSHLWNFDDGNSSTIQNPNHLYANPGTYVVTLTVTDSFGCFQSISDTVIVRPFPQADFTLSGTTCFTDTLCLNQSKTFTDTSIIPGLGGGASLWQWDIGNNGIVDYTTNSITHSFIDTGWVDIRMVVGTQFGCNDTVVKSFYVVPDPEANFSLDTNIGCDGHIVQITNNSEGFIESYRWSLFSLNATGQPTIISTGTGMQPASFPALTSSITQDTTYYLSLVAESCCASDSTVESIVIKPTPIAKFVALDTLGCSPLPISFLVDGQTTGLPDFIIFDYGDGSPIDTIYPTTIVLPTGPVTGFGLVNHTFYYNGPNNDTTYTVTLTAVNNCGTSTYSGNIKVFPNTIAAFFTSSQTNGCAPMTVNFNGLTPNSILTNWTFDLDTTSGNWGANTSQGSNVSYTFTTPGIYFVAMSVTDGCGNDTMVQQITVLPSPTAGFTFNNNVCSGDTVFFQNTSTVNNGVIMANQWEFGDGQVSAIQNPFVVYDSAGTFNTCLIVFSDNGCPDTLCQQVTIRPKPEIDFDAPDACLNQQPINFNNLSTISTGNITFTQWDFGDGNTSANFSPQHTYSSPGLYTVKLIHQGTGQCRDSIEKVVEIFPIPEASFSMSRPTGDSCGVPQTIEFTNTSAGALSYYWDFDAVNRPDSITSTQPNPSVTFTDFGRYTVRLIAINGFGCSDTSEIEVVVQPNPFAGFRVDTLSGCQPFTVMFTDESSFTRPDLGANTRWIYHFGDGNIQDGGNPNAIHTYADTGTYFPFLIVTTDYGCRDTFYLPTPIRVRLTPKADFELEDYQEGIYAFENLSNYGRDGVSFVWDMGDGNRYHTEHVSHRYQINRLISDFTFNICLLVETEFGCEDSICRELFLPRLNLSVPNALAPTLPHAGEAGIFQPKGHSLITYKFQVFDQWGNLVFQTDKLTADGQPLEAWNGKKHNSGELLPSGTYAWKIEAVFEDGTRWPGVPVDHKKSRTSGTIHLIR